MREVPLFFDMPGSVTFVTNADRHFRARSTAVTGSMMAAKRPPPEQTHYYAMTGGSRAVNVKFTPAPRPTRKAYPKYVAGGPLKSYVPGALVLSDGTILPPREPSRLVKAAMMKRAATADALAATTSWPVFEPDRPESAGLGMGRASTGHFSTEYSRSYATPRQAGQRWVGMTTESWAKQDACIYKACPMVCRDGYYEATT